MDKRNRMKTNAINSELDSAPKLITLGELVNTARDKYS